MSEHWSDQDTDSVPLRYDISAFSERYANGLIGTDVEVQDAAEVLEKIERSIIRELEPQRREKIQRNEEYEPLGFELEKRGHTVAEFRLYGGKRPSLEGLRSLRDSIDSVRDIHSAVFNPERGFQRRIQGTVNPIALYGDKETFEEWRRSVEPYLEAKIGPTEANGKQIHSYDGRTSRAGGRIDERV